MPVLQTLLTTRGADPSSRVYISLRSAGIPERIKYVHTKFHENLSDSVVEMGGGGHTDSMVIHTYLFVLGRGVGKKLQATQNGPQP